MRKRRVLALLLALSLVVSGNGMTVLAAEQGADMPVLASQEDAEETAPEEKEDTSGGTENTSGEDAPETDDKSEETKNPSEGEGSDEEDKTGEGDNSENPETPVDPEESDPSAPKEDDTEQGGDQSSTEDGEQSGDPSSVEDGEDGGQEEEPGAEVQDPEADAQEPSVSENDVDETEELEEELEEKTGEVRMMSFTDASGLQITFDANAAEENAENVLIDENGVLTGIKEGTTVEGVIDLRKKEFTAIGEGAFQGKTEVTYVMLPKTVTSIRKNGFSGCGKLKGISIPSRLETIGESAFENCEKLTQLAIPNSVTSIEASAFKGNSRLFMVNMASVDYSKLTTIGESAFEGCSALEFFCSDDDYKLPNSLTTIGANAFKNCTKIDEVDMGNGITALGEGAFQNCSGIREVEISACIGTVPRYAFAGCIGLIEIEFNSMYNSVEVPTIELASYAFQGCSKLGSLELTQDVHIVNSNAFADCMALRRVRIDDNRALLYSGAFPADLRRELCIIGLSANSAAARYADDGNHRFICFDDKEKKEYYTYTAKLSGTLVDTGQIKLKVTNNKDSLTSAYDTIKDINDITNSDATDKNYQKGVKAGTECYVVYTKPTGISLVAGSLACNGEEIKKDSSGRYKFSMPVGGAAITAEFEADVAAGSTVPGSKDNIEGRLSSEVDYDYERNIGSMDVGQSAKFYLINTYNGGMSRIPTSKITYEISPNSSSGVVSVSKDGTIKALKEGTGTVEASVNTDGGRATVSVTIRVGKTYIHHIGIQVEDDTVDSKSELRTEWVDKDEHGNIIGVSIPEDRIGTGLEFDVEAEAFTTEDDANSLAVAFTWSSSDSKVAKLEKTSTKAGDSENEIKIPAGANGEATITVSAKGEDEKKVTRKFTVSVQSYEPRLTASKITVNPNQDEGATTIGVIDAYGRPIDDSKIIKAKDVNGREVGFVFKKVGEKEGLVTTYSVSALSSLVEKTYNVKLDIDVNVNSGTLTYQPPLTIVVKKSEPKPTVSFDKKAPKINLFLANDGVEIHPVIGKLGDHKVSEYSLEPLTLVGHKNYENDKLFTDNFQIDKQTGTITQKAPNLKKSNNGTGKPVLTGYLVLKFEGFGDLTKRYKITIPTQTVAPSYVLDKTSGTFGTDKPTPIELTLLDKKKKQPIPWDDAYTLAEGANTTCAGVRPILVKGTGVIGGVEQDVVKIKVEFEPNPIKGKLCMILKNRNWAEGKSFTYTYNVKTDTKPAQIKLKKATITLNTNYPKNKEAFELVSNHEDTEFAKEYEFVPRPNRTNEKILGKLTVKCTDGKGEVFFGDENTTDYSFVKNIPAGSYKYQAVYTDKNLDTKRIAMTIKIVGTTPTVTMKGTNALNLKAWTNGENGEKNYVEVSEMSVTAKNLPNVEKWLEKPGDGGNDGSTGEGGSIENPDSGSTGEGSSTENPGGGSTGGDGGSTGNPDSGTDGNGGNAKQPQQISTVSAGKINPEYYLFDAETTFKFDKNDAKSMQFTTKGCESWNPQEYFKFEWADGEKASEGKIRISLKKEMPAKTYTLKMTPTYKNGINPNPVQTARPVSFKVKVYSGDISVTLKAKGKINLLNREVAEKNGIQYTPSFKNLKDTLAEVRLLDVNDGTQASYDQPDRISKQFTPVIAEDGKSFYIVPKAGADLKNKTNYKLRVWVRTKGYVFTRDGGGAYASSNITVKTAEILPKVKTDQTTANLYMSSKAYEATFIVKKSDEKAIGAIESIAFGEKDEKANDSFVVYGKKLDDGSLEVHLKLKNGVTYGCNTTNKIKMYIQFTGQGTNTAGTPITMNVKINK